jgi:hypothetical protein
MSKYTIQRLSKEAYNVVNPNGVPIAFYCSWRAARKIVDALNAAAAVERGA